MKMKAAESHRQKRGGYTLLEIIAVLLILGVLAAVAATKYFDMHRQAKERALEGALAEGMSTVSMAYAQQMLSWGGAISAAGIATKATAEAPSGGDFSYIFDGSSGDIRVIVRPIAGGAVDGAGSVSKLWLLP